MVPAKRATRAPSVHAAYLLHRYDWSESSAICDLFTREAGRIAVAAKGAKRPYSQLRAVLLPFQRMQVSLGRTPKTSGDVDEASPPDVQTLRQAEWAGGPSMLTGSALFSGFYVNELLMKLMARHDAHPALFDTYAATLAHLTGDERQAQAALRAFELALLRETGVLPDLSVDTPTQRPLDPNARYALTGDFGLGPPRPDAPTLDGTTWVRIEAALGHGSFEALHATCFHAVADLRSVLRALLHYHLAGPPLRTRRVMRELQALQSSLPTSR